MTPSSAHDALARLATLGMSYASTGLSEDDLASEPYTQFARWLDDAIAAPLPEPHAMVLATADSDGRPSARTVLLKAVDPRGFVFMTNYSSRKGRELTDNPHASLVFPWFAMLRQVVVVGRVERTSPEESAAYFATRPRGSQLAAWTSDQSSVIANRAELDERYADVGRQFPADEDVPVPPGWGGFVVRPDTIEFWHGQASRLHDRLQFVRVGDGAGGIDEAPAWRVQRLSP